MILESKICMLIYNYQDSRCNIVKASVLEVGFIGKLHLFLILIEGKASHIQLNLCFSCQSWWSSRSSGCSFSLLCRRQDSTEEHSRFPMTQCLLKSHHKWEDRLNRPVKEERLMYLTFFFILIHFPPSQITLS